jgi:hypothetical protein
MAQRTINIDDLDPTVDTDVETVRFGLDGAGYEIDLGKANRTKLEKALEPFLDKARRDASAPRRTAAGGSVAQKGRTSTSKADNEAVRAWAKENGHQVSERGRISNTVIQAYEAAQASAKS